MYPNDRVRAFFIGCYHMLCVCMCVCVSLALLSLVLLMDLRIKLETIICSIMVKDTKLAISHIFLDIRYVDWAELHRNEFKGVIFDNVFLSLCSHLSC